jgi:lysophospholipase L1-like esterase
MVSWMLWSVAALSVCATAAYGQARGEPSASFAEFDRRAAAGEPLSVVFFGGSLTWGANASDPQRTSYRGLMADYLRQRYPRCPFTFHDAAIGGTGSKLGMFRIERDVLAFKPDLVFLDFTANDDLYGSDVSTLASYECLLRRLIERKIPVVQVMLGFRFNFGTQYNLDKLARRRDHLRLAQAYGTAVGDLYPTLQAALVEGRVTLEQLWPIDGAHPDDPGYREFFAVARDGFEAAVRDGRTCVLPAEPVFSDQYQKRQRLVLVDRPLPAGWRRERTYRVAAWFDGLSSRWMGDVAVADASVPDLAPLELEFEGTLVGVFGEGDDQSAGFEVYIDGQRRLTPARKGVEPAAVWPFDTKKLGGRLMVWRELANDLSPGRHTLRIVPVFQAGVAKSQLRLESVCVAGQ